MPYLDNCSPQQQGGFAMRDKPFDVFVTTSDGDSYKAAMIPAALDALCERRLPMRRNLAGVVAKKAKAAWIETVMKTKAELA
jgi:hypothetical protein